MQKLNWKFKNTDSGKYFWEATSDLDRPSDKILGRSSQQFKSQSGCKYNSDLLGRSGKFSSKLNWGFKEEAEGWSWKCDNTVNKENVGASHTLFLTEELAKENAYLFGYDWVSRVVKSELNDTDTSAKANPKVVSAEAVVGAGVASNFVHSHNSDLDSDFDSHSKKSQPFTNPQFSDVKTDLDYDYSDSEIKSTKSTQRRNDDEINWSFLKWLVPLLLLLLLLWWLIPLFLNQTKVAQNITNNNSSNSSVLGAQDAKLDYKTALADPKYSTLLGVVGSSGVGGDLNGLTSATILAPNNSAFTKVSSENLTKLTFAANQPILQNILKGHILSGGINLNDLKDGGVVKTLAGNELPVKRDGENMTIGGLNIDLKQYSNTKPFNILEIDQIILPEVFSSKLISPVAPILPAQPVSSQTAPITSFKAGGSLEALNNDGRFTLLFKALDVSGLATDIENTPDLTVFAPTDDALKTVPNLAEYLNPENKTKLQSFLKQHVVAGKNPFTVWSAGKSLTTLAGTTLQINTSNSYGIGQVISKNNLTIAPIDDINTTNAVIHILPNAPIL